jgi:hypothetical protein
MMQTRNIILEDMDLDSHMQPDMDTRVVTRMRIDEVITWESYPFLMKPLKVKGRHTVPTGALTAQMKTEEALDVDTWESGPEEEPDTENKYLYGYARGYPYVYGREG